MSKRTAWCWAPRSWRNCRLAACRTRWWPASAPVARLIGVGQAFRAINPAVRLFAMEPSESCTLLCGEIALHQIEGISDGFVPGIFQRHASLVDEVLSVSSGEAIESMRHLARRHGLFCGPSSGAHLLAARRVRERHPELRTVVTLFCDEGEKYLQEHFMRGDSVTVNAGHFA